MPARERSNFALGGSDTVLNALCWVAAGEQRCGALVVGLVAALRSAHVQPSGIVVHVEV